MINTAFDWGRRRKRRPAGRGGDEGELARMRLPPMKIPPASYISKTFVSPLTVPSIA